MRNKFTLSLLFAPILVVSGCLGGGGDGGTDSLSITGVAIDGYLGQATVCLDLNRNMVCDDNEPRAITAADGTYTITGVTQAQINNFPVVVEAIAGTTTDTDLNGDLIPRSFSLTSPPGQGAVVSPLTTMVQADMFARGVNLNFATKSIAKLLSKDEASVLNDFISDSGENSETHRFAQIIARMLVSLSEDLEKLEGDSLAKQSFAEETILKYLDVIVGQDLSSSTVDELQNDADEIRNSLITAGVKEFTKNETKLQEQLDLKQERNQISLGRGFLSTNDFLDLFTTTSPFIYEIYRDGKEEGITKIHFDATQGVGYDIRCKRGNNFSSCFPGNIADLEGASGNFDYPFEFVDGELVVYSDEGETKAFAKITYVNETDISGKTFSMASLNYFGQFDRDEVVLAKRIIFPPGSIMYEYGLEHIGRSEPSLADLNCSNTFDFNCADNKNLGSVTDLKNDLLKDGKRFVEENNDGVKFEWWFSDNMEKINYCLKGNCDETTLAVNSYYNFRAGEFLYYFEMPNFIKNRQSRLEVFIEDQGAAYEKINGGWYLNDYIRMAGAFNKIAAEAINEQVFSSEP
ncbi:hypothetical protein [Thiomicrospira cyclica]|uniref:Lipoprotein n=1 Tax=Thiomicrospira cyclica (strain DSM 14477 / JCM 11371 / ALM1) TaxID=717773 RepID=F6DD22_THICA|nr:hypothetical protein [Thiomicrospira cyclica]AEG31758.1 hypothetical protein Thicy_0991 [Thiomicrospira cyclica ALM1]